MFQVMIADDEHVIKNGLKNFIDWSELDCQIVNEASNGLEALEALKTKKIDIVITDIKMPALNGIELSEIIYKHYPKTKVILLTGFADFSFAQSAIQYGVIDFIIKTNPIDKVQDAIRKAKNLIIQQREADSKIRKLEEEMINTLPEIKRSFLQDVLHRSIHSADVEYKAQSLGINLKHYFIVAFDLKAKLDTEPDNPDKQEHIITSLINFLNQSFQDYSPILLIPSNEMVIMLVSFEEHDYSLHIRDVNRICNELIQISDNFMNTVVSIGVSNMHTSLLELHIAYEEARQALSEKFYTGLQISYYMPKDSSPSPVIELEFKQRIQQMIHHVQMDDGSSAVNEMKEIIQQLRATNRTIQQTKAIGNLVCSVCSNLLLNCDMLNNKMEYTLNKFDEIANCESIVSLSNLMIDMIESVTSIVNAKIHDNISIEKVIKYIEANYSMDIDLQMLANHVHLNSSYLSRLFKKETGETITEALTRYRIEQAKLLLQKSEIKAYVVGMMVGISDSAYFSNVFKKYTGLSPKDYRAQLKK
ncbi:response regulator [Paenibacillus sp. GCM10027626]|uniref:response regulator n=1 Tax=Paenibacillus sp. GCM10027626 TaxID=3273411 RepID=UPI00363A60E1